MTSVAEIKNWLLIVSANGGNQVKVPGFEPLSPQTADDLLVSMQNSYAFIPLDVALELIEGSRVVITSPSLTAGTFGSQKYFEIPEGPPPNGMQCPSNNVLDSYKILQDYARTSDQETGGCKCTIEDECNEQRPYNSGGGCNIAEFESGLS